MKAVRAAFGSGQAEQRGTKGEVFRELAHGMTDRLFENNQRRRDFRYGSIASF
jgi:hypothetical protein